jgi:hypothetical protein
MPLRELFLGGDHFNRVVVQLKIGVIAPIRPRFIQKTPSVVYRSPRMIVANMR